MWICRLWSNYAGLYTTLSCNICIILNVTGRVFETKTSCVGFEVFTAVVMKSTIFWDVTPCCLLSCNRRFGGTYRLHLQGQAGGKLATCLLAGSCWNYFFGPEDGGDMFLRNVGCNSKDYMTSYPRRWYSLSLFVCYLTTLWVSRLHTVNNRMVNENGAICGVRIGRENRSTLRSFVPVPL
jgi:hypothetical protein